MLELESYSSFLNFLVHKTNPVIQKNHGEKMVKNKIIAGCGGTYLWIIPATWEAETRRIASLSPTQAKIFRLYLNNKNKGTEGVAQMVKPCQGSEFNPSLPKITNNLIYIRNRN
jgi:hypothetical protein